MDTGNRAAIIIVDNSVALTGALKAIVNATVHLKDDFNFIFVLPEGSTALEFVRQQGFTVHALPFVEISKRVKSLLFYLPFLLINGIRLHRLSRKHRASIIHMNDFYNLAGIVAKATGAPVRLVTHVRFMPQKFSSVLANTWAWLNLAFADRIICVSEAVRFFFPASDKVTVIADPIPEFECHPPRAETAAAAGPVRLLYLSNFIPGKGQEVALAAFRRAYTRNQDLRLVFAGGDMGLEKNKVFRQRLEQEVVEAGLSQVVSFKGFVLDVEAEIKGADICLNFSESESFSLTCLDALFYGTPIIATDCGGPAELFEHGSSGLLVPVGDVSAMTQAILELAGDESRRRQFSHAGKDYVRMKFGPGESYLKLKKYYKQLLHF